LTAAGGNSWPTVDMQYRPSKIIGAQLGSTLTLRPIPLDGIAEKETAVKAVTPVDIFPGTGNVAMAVNQSETSDQNTPPQGREAGGRNSVKPGGTFLLTFCILFTLWIVFSGRFDVFHLAMGVIASALVSFFCRDFLFTSEKPRVLSLFRIWIRLAGYIPWLMVQIFRANLHVLYIVFHPRMMTLIDPHIIDFDSRLKSDYSRTTFANSITLTPGTITVRVTVLGRFSVHCIDADSGRPLPGQMEERIGKVFSE
jgi:multicomponent Na+:H+ antiporter subunit E